MAAAVIGRVHRSVAGSLLPRKITLLSNITSHVVLSNVTVHPARHSGQMPINEATARCGTTCPCKMVGKLGMAMLHTCVDLTVHPLGK